MVGKAMLQQVAAKRLDMVPKDLGGGVSFYQQKPLRLSHMSAMKAFRKPDRIFTAVLQRDQFMLQWGLGAQAY